MGRLPTVKISAPDVDGGFIVINESDFDPEKHERFEGTEPEAAQGAAGDEGPEDDGAGAATDEVEPTLPDGYTMESQGGGYYFLQGPSGAVIPGPSNGKWQGKDAAIQAAVHHAEKHGA